MNAGAATTTVDAGRPTIACNAITKKKNVIVIDIVIIMKKFIFLTYHVVDRLINLINFSYSTSNHSVYRLSANPNNHNK